MVLSMKTSCCERRVAFAQCKQICAMLNQELDYLCVPLHACDVQRRVAEVACFVHLDARFG